METRIRELESELDAENRRLADAQKNLRRSERRITELTFQQDEDRKNHERMQVELMTLSLLYQTILRDLRWKVDVSPHRITRKNWS
jgi:predicted  nucleic acid-binding Zn-ribbon protein